MKNLIIVLIGLLSFVSVNSSASTSNMSDAQKIESLQQEVQVLRQIIIQSQYTQAKPMCLTTGERCESQFDICCSDGQYCFIGAICR